MQLIESHEGLPREFTAGLRIYPVDVEALAIAGIVSNLSVASERIPRITGEALERYLEQDNEPSLALRCAHSKALVKETRRYVDTTDHDSALNRVIGLINNIHASRDGEQILHVDVRPGMTEPVTASKILARLGQVMNRPDLLNNNR